MEKCPQCDSELVEVHFGNGITLLRCMNCQKTPEQVLSEYGFIIKE